MRMLKRHSRQDVTTSETYVNKDYHPRTERTKNVTKPLSVQTLWRHTAQEHNYYKQNSAIKRDRFVNISPNEKNVPLTKTALRALFCLRKKKKKKGANDQWFITAAWLNQASTSILWKIISPGDLHQEPIWPGQHSNPALDLNGALNFERFMSRQTKNERKIQKKKKPQHIILECVKPQFSDDGACKSGAALGRGFVFSPATRKPWGTATPVPVFTTELSPATRPKGLGYLCFNKLLKPTFQHRFSRGLDGRHEGWSYGCVRIWRESERSADSSEHGKESGR